MSLFDRQRACRISAIAIFLSLNACASGVRGVPRIVDSAGAVQAPPGARGTADTTLSAATLDLRQRFRAHAAAAVSADGDEQVPVAKMVRSGVLLARANCDDFFAGAAVLQRRTNISRDVIAPVISVLTNVVALQNLGDGDSGRYLKILSVGSGAALAGISIVDQHFLFGAENIKEVRDLTFQALAAHEEAISEVGAASFDDGIQQLIDHQVVCSPASILALTKQAIAAGQVVAETSSSTSQDEQALTQLASATGLIGAATPKQAAALWALYQGGVPADAIPRQLELDLTSAGLAKLIDPSTPAQDATDAAPADEAHPAKLSEEGRSKANQIIAILKTFSAGTRAELAQAAAGNREGRTSLDQFDVVLSPPASRARSVKLVVH